MQEEVRPNADGEPRKNYNILERSFDSQVTPATFNDDKMNYKKEIAHIERDHAPANVLNELCASNDVC